MFRRTRPLTDPVTIEFEGRPIEAARGDSVAAALLVAGVIEFRSSLLDGSPRGPHCLIGNCFDCLVEVDEQPNVQSCRETVRPGMIIRRQSQ